MIPVVGLVGVGRGGYSHSHLETRYGGSMNLASLELSVRAWPRMQTHGEVASLLDQP